MTSGTLNLFVCKQEERFDERCMDFFNNKYFNVTTVITSPDKYVYKFWKHVEEIGVDEVDEGDKKYAAGVLEFAEVIKNHKDKYCYVSMEVEDGIARHVTLKGDLIPTDLLPGYEDDGETQEYEKFLLKYYRLFMDYYKGQEKQA